jgi:hypothetical protein
MADVDPTQLGTSGVDPQTGSTLSPTVRNALLRTSVINSDTFKRQKDEEDAKNSDLIQKQQTIYTSINSSIQSLRDDISKLGENISKISLSFYQDQVTDQNKIKNDQEYERKLTERKVRIGKEDELEQKIQSAVVAPVQKLVPQVQDLFGRVGTALTILFGGWLTNQTIQALKASEENNTEKFNDIKYNILKNVGIIVGGFIAIKTGFGLITRTISKIAFGLTRLLIAKPLAAAAALLTLPFRGGNRTPPSGGGKPSGGGGRNIFGSIINFAYGAFDFMQRKGQGQTNLQAGLGAGGSVVGAEVGAGLGSRLPGILKFPGVIAGGILGYTLGGKGVDILTGADKTTTSNDITQTPKPASEKPTESSSPTSAVTMPYVNMANQFEMSRDKIEKTWNKITLDKNQQEKYWTQLKGYNWSDIKLSEPQTEPPTKIESTNIKPAEMTAPPKPPTSVSALPEPKPTFTVIRTGNNQQQITSPQPNGSLTDVPLISSSNPDNFYVLYSQLSYNVVI